MMFFSNFTIETYDESCDLQTTKVTDLKGLDWSQLLESGNNNLSMDKGKKQIIYNSKFTLSFGDQIRRFKMPFA